MSALTYSVVSGFNEKHLSCLVAQCCKITWRPCENKPKPRSERSEAIGLHSRSFNFD